jgi:DNA-directed RNA polymerase specialized sigma24 family protein
MNHFATDTELLDAIRIDNATAFEDLIGRYWFFLYQYSYAKTKSKQSAAEITRNIFIEIWENRHFIPADFSLQAYLREKVRKSTAYHLYRRIVEEPSNTELTTYLDTEFSLNNLRSAYRPVSQSAKESTKMGTYIFDNQAAPKKMDEQNYFLGWKLLINNLVLGFRKTFF